MRSRRYCFTLNNYKTEETDEGERPVFVLEAEKSAVFKGFLCGEEVGANGTKHLQGYFELENARTIRGLQKLKIFSENPMHLEVAKGSVDDNRKYCFKEDGEHYEFGEFRDREGQGKRTDWDLVHRLAENGADDLEFLEQVPHLAYPHVNKIQTWKKKHKKMRREWKTKPIIFYGPPRAGKSTRMRRLAKELADERDEEVYFKSDADKWWPDYEGERIVCIDEMHGGFFQWQQLLRTFEEGPLVVQQKGGDHPFMAEYVFMTTNIHPQLWYKDRPWDKTNAFRARVKEFGELWVFEEPTENMDGTMEYHEPVRDYELLAVDQGGVSANVVGADLWGK